MPETDGQQRLAGDLGSAIYARIDRVEPSVLPPRSYRRSLPSQVSICYANPRQYRVAGYECVQIQSTPQRRGAASLPDRGEPADNGGDDDDSITQLIAENVAVQGFWENA